ncbi:MAG: aldo/keto reductase [Clostridia bacterium]|nr:aldo/keto reductase [Clostridia bacterium]
MKEFRIKGTDFHASKAALGCMRIGGLDEAALDRLIQTALECQINFFDHADIYGGGGCETLFGNYLKKHPSLRDKMIIQSKCGIRNGCYDFSKEHLLQAVDGILKRLQIEQLDTLLLHRPDILVEPEVVADVFDTLHAAGKVRYFGVSNHNPMQIALLQKYVKQPIVINQLQFSMTNTTMIDSGVNVNMENEAAVNRDGSVLDFCRLHDITIQAWSPFQYGFFEGTYIGNPKFAQLNGTIDALCEKYQLSNSALVIAWILRHPAGIQPIIGSTNPDRIREIAKAFSTEISHEDWYKLYLASGKKLP